LQLGRRTLAALAAGVLLSGCAMPAASLSPNPSVTAAAQRASISPDAWRGSLLYVGGDKETYVFKYPGGRLLGSIPIGSFGMCSDAKGDVFVTRVSVIFEFPHGGTTPVAIYKAPGTVYSCAVDPTTQNFAAVVFCLSGCGDSIAVYRQYPQAPPTIFHDSKLHSMLYCGYDAAGNLYVDGYDKNGAFMISELPAGAQSFTNITFRDNIAAAGQIQWDGTYMTVETRFQPKIYRLKLSRSGGKIVSTTQLTGVGARSSQSWIQGNAVLVPTGPGNKRPKVIGMWKYPRGGKEIRRLGGFIPPERQIDGVTVSVKPKG
jgi:hypothetical protein